MKPKTRQWLRKADADLRGAQSMLLVKPSLNDLVCFHSQQAVEKYLKALLEESSFHVPKTHDLALLATLLMPRYPQLKLLVRGLDRLTVYAVETRYPGETTTRREAQSAIRWAARAREVCRSILGL